jgi:phospholipid/cholesterol/gamma-HCH transport system permease protein
MPTAQEPTLTLNAGAVAATGTWQVHALAQGKAMATITTPSIPQGRPAEMGPVGHRQHGPYRRPIVLERLGQDPPGQPATGAGLEEFFKRLETTGTLELPRTRQNRLTLVMKLGFAMLLFFEHLAGLLRLIGQVVLDSWRFARTLRGPWKEISANIYHAGFQALGITALVGFLIGVVFSYLSAQQLRNFGGDIFLVNLLGMSIIRELGPLLAAILVAGRSGSSITAQLGVMRVTEELDAMLVMGISHGFRLIMPKVLALAIAMPLLVIWTDTIALMGGMVSASRTESVAAILPAETAGSRAAGELHDRHGQGRGVRHADRAGVLPLRPAHQAEYRKPGRGTTTSVVTAITAVILADAVFAIVFSGVGF